MSLGFNVSNKLTILELIFFQEYNTDALLLFKKLNSNSRKYWSKISVIELGVLISICTLKISSSNILQTKLKQICRFFQNKTKRKLMFYEGNFQNKYVVFKWNKTFDRCEWVCVWAGKLSFRLDSCASEAFQRPTRLGKGSSSENRSSENRSSENQSFENHSSENQSLENLSFFEEALSNVIV